MAKKMMHAVQYSGYGGGTAALKHVEIVVPDPKPDEVLVKVEAAALNPLDWKIQKGMLRPFLPRKFPAIPGIDLAGEVAQVGSAVKKFKTGDKVVALVSHTLTIGNTTGGSLAEYAVAKESTTVCRPPEVSAPEGAALPIAALTARSGISVSFGGLLDC